VTCPNALNRSTVERELVRRDARRDKISQMSPTERALALQVEVETQQRWEKRRAEAQRYALDRACGATAEPPSTPYSGDSQTNDMATPVGGPNTFSRLGQWARRNVKLMSIPLVPLRRRVPEPGEV
jgi:hypothetical protein